MKIKNLAPHILTIIALVLFIALSLASGSMEPARQTGNSGNNGQLAQTQGSGQSNSPSVTYFTGDGGRGMRLAVLEPSVNGLSEDEQKWIPSTIQSSITGDFNRFSAITIIDRQNFEKILEEQTLSMSGYFSDEDYLRIGHLTNNWGWSLSQTVLPPSAKMHLPTTA